LEKSIFKENSEIKNKKKETIKITDLKNNEDALSNFLICYLIAKGKKEVYASTL